jgi:hypothetical protein
MRGPDIPVALDMVDMSSDQPSNPVDMLDMVSDADSDIPDVDMVRSEGFGAISGQCDVLGVELTAASGVLRVNSIDFGDDPYDDEDKDLLTMGGQEIIDDGNAGGSSVLSEVFSFEVLQRCEGATLLKTETEIEYKMQGKITDLLVQIDGVKIGVSVTRAVKFPRDQVTMFEYSRARTLLEKKLGDVLLSSANVAMGDLWSKQILHVLAYDRQHADVIQDAYNDIGVDLTADTIVLVTITDGQDEFIY